MNSVVMRMLARNTMHTTFVVLDVTPRFLELDLPSNLDIARRADLGNAPACIVRCVHVHTSEVQVRTLARDTNEIQPRLSPANLKGLTHLDAGTNPYLIEFNARSRDYRLLSCS